MDEYQGSSLWRKALGARDGDPHPAQRAYFREQYLGLREKVRHVVAQIPKDILGLTVHDITHLDALWEIASTIAGDNYDLNAVEGYIFGAAVLFHDAGMAIASYPGGLADVYGTGCMERRSRCRIACSSSEPMRQLAASGKLRIRVLSHPLMMVHCAPDCTEGAPRW
jgi:hypothetical protein